MYPREIKEWSSLVLSLVWSEKVRLTYLDTFRGLALALMVLANNGVLAESNWNGLTLADCIFPTFIFLVGVSIPFSKLSKLRVLRRTVTLFALGFLLTNNWTFSDILTNFRVLGVLQRIAVCYLFAALVYRTVKSKRTRLVLISVLLIGYCLVMIQYPLTQSGNLGAIIDRSVLGTAHIFNGVYDPEGILSTLPAIATCLIGLGVGEYLKEKKPLESLVNYGIMALVLGLVWSLVFPVNKQLWTSSFVLVVGGIDILVLVLLSFMNERASFPLRALGSSVIFIYCLNSIVNIYVNVPIVDNLLRALVILAMWVLLSSVLYWKRIFIRV